MKNPVERLRNKLSPFLNLAKMLSETENELKPFKDDRLNAIINIEIQRCAENADDIRHHLHEADELIDPDSSLRYKYNRDNILTNLPKTVDSELYNFDPTVHHYVQLLSRAKNNEYLSVIDEMFVYYTSMKKVYQDQIDTLTRNIENNTTHDWKK